MATPQSLIGWGMSAGPERGFGFWLCETIAFCLVLAGVELYYFEHKSVGESARPFLGGVLVSALGFTWPQIKGRASALWSRLRSTWRQWRANGGSLKVRATQVGFYGNSRRREGDVFTLSSAKHFSSKWMVWVDASTPEKVTTSSQALLRVEATLRGVDPEHADQMRLDDLTRRRAQEIETELTDTGPGAFARSHRRMISQIAEGVAESEVGVLVQELRAKLAYGRDTLLRAELHEMQTTWTWSDWLDAVQQWRSEVHWLLKAKANKRDANHFNEELNPVVLPQSVGVLGEEHTRAKTVLSERIRRLSAIIDVLGNESAAG